MQAQLRFLDQEYEAAKLVHNQPLADLLLAWSGLVDELQEEDVFMQSGGISGQC